MLDSIFTTDGIRKEFNNLADAGYFEKKPQRSHAYIAYSGQSIAGLMLFEQ